MITLLTHLFIPNYEQVTLPEVRQKYGILSGGVGICLNILLFAFKLLTGILSSSISIIADAFNNLSDAGSAIITLIGFQISGQEADSDHPFGHGRSEYISGLIVSVIILFMAIELIHSSIDKILHPQSILFTPFVVAVLTASILIKLYMYYYNKALSRKISSSALQATAADSFSDALSTLLVLAAAVISHLSGFHVDGYCGVVVGFIIFAGGVQAAKDTISPLLGQAPDPDFLNQIHTIVEQYEDVLDLHDLVVHDYGPGRRMISLHAEVPAKGDILALHDTIDNIEKHLENELHCSAVIHMDPVMNDDEETSQLKLLVTKLLKEVDPVLTLHDFRIVKGTTHTNLIFDVVVPYKVSYSKEFLQQSIEQKLAKTHQNYYCVIEIDHG